MREKVKRPGEKVRRKQIIDAATTEFGTKSYHWATTKEIAERAGVSERTVFFYFDNKKQLYRSVFRQAFEEFIAAVVRANPPTNDYRTFFKMTGRNLLNFLHENPIKFKLLLQGLDTTADPELREDYLNVLTSLYNFVREFMIAAREKEEVSKDTSIDAATTLLSGAYVIAAFAEVLDLDWFQGEHDDIEAIVDYFIDNITGVEPKPAGKRAAEKVRNEIQTKGGSN